MTVILPLKKLFTEDNGLPRYMNSFCYSRILVVVHNRRLVVTGLWYICPLILSPCFQNSETPQFSYGLKGGGSLQITILNYNFQGNGLCLD